MQRLTVALSLFLLGAATGCSGVYPTYSSTPFEAAYQLRSRGASFGSASVSAGAAREVELGGRQRVVVPVTVEIDNESHEELRVNAGDVTLAYVITSGGRVDGADIEVVSRKVSEAADGVARVEASFALPPGHAAKEVMRLAVRWSFSRADGELFEDLTGFRVPAPGAMPVVNEIGLAPAGSSQFDIYGGYPGPAVGYLPDTGVDVPPPIVPPPYLPVQPPNPGRHDGAQPAISNGHAPAQPSIGGGRR